METLASQAALALRLTLLVETQHRAIVQLRDSNDQLELHRSVLERAHEIHLRLTDAVIAGADFQSVAQILAGLVGRPTAVVDAHGALLSTSDPPPDAELATGFAASLAHLERPQRARRVHGAQQPAVGVLVGPIRIGSETLGHVLVGEGDPASRDLDVRAIEHAATVLAVHVTKERVARATEERLCSDFLLDLLNGRDTPHRLGERAGHYGLAFGDEHHVLVAVVHWAEQPVATERSEAEAKRRRATMPRVAADTLRERLPDSLLSQVGDVVTAVVPTAGLADAPTALRNAAGECRRRIRQLAPGVRLSVGIGSAAQRPAAFVVSHGEAQQCVELLRRLDREDETIAIDELGVLGLFLDTNRPEHLVALGRHVLGPALDHDAKRDGALVPTLEVYFDRSCDLRACAEQLFIHVNTVKYRLRRLEELCGLDLRNPDDLLKATIARLSLKLLEAEPTALAT
jgi:sugar diacid utilization regulator